MELGKREYLENGGDIIFVVGPSGGGKSTVVDHLTRLGDAFLIPSRVINDGDYIATSVKQAEQEGTGGFYRKPNGGFVITDQAIIERAYRKFFSDIARREYTGYPIIVEWAGGVKKEGVEGVDVSYETLGKILMEYGQEIMPRVRAVLNLVTDRETRETRNKFRTGENAKNFSMTMRFSKNLMEN